jgi:hypothetical protein
MRHFVAELAFDALDKAKLATAIVLLKNWILPGHPSSTV